MPSQAGGQGTWVFHRVEIPLREIPVHLGLPAGCWQADRPKSKAGLAGCPMPCLAPLWSHFQSLHQLVHPFLDRYRPPDGGGREEGDHERSHPSGAALNWAFAVPWMVG